MAGTISKTILNKKKAMTPEEKAHSMIVALKNILPRMHYDVLEEAAKQCAIICVDEILKMFDGLHKPEYVAFDVYEPKQYSMEGETDFNGYTMQAYWQEVKSFIQNTNV